MILTTKGRYAIIAIIDLIENSLNSENSDSNKVIPVSLLKIAKRQEISLSYLEQIFANLKKAGIVKAVKGPGGGYILSKKPEEVKTSEVILATGEKIKMTLCSDNNPCPFTTKQGKKCKTHDLWKNLENNIFNYLSSVSLADICKNDKHN